MIKILTISIFVISFCLLCNGSNHDYSFDGSSFNFNAWQQSNNGFQCRRDDRYVIMCNLRWDTIMNELSNCEFGTAFMQCATGTNTVMFTLIGIETIAIGILLLYIYRKPKIDVKERAEVQKCLRETAKKSDEVQ